MINNPTILLIYAHPEPHHSIANKALISAASELGHVTVHDLYGIYPDFFIDIRHEQELLRQHDIIVFQHPLYTYSCPALLKEWFDRVLTRDFSGEQGGRQLSGKYWRQVITTGEPAEAYQHGGYNRFPISELLRPFELTAALCEMHWLAPVILYAARRQGKAMLHEQAQAYCDWLRAPQLTGGRKNGAN